MKKLRLIILIIIAFAGLSSCDNSIALPNVIEFQEPDYSALWMVGNATPAGWNISNPTPMTVNPTDKFEFIYEGALTAGEFKIPTKTGDWGCDFFMPITAGEDISGTVDVKLVVGGSPDQKWVVSVPGNYKITLNIKHPVSIKIVKQ